ncbi:hypothetical protein INS49_001495 [Diaporthe citri]|uniref:uncharacterized protein n=1 Tax=Diaporthe citri TaxID=83186 RepID=UPI001C811BA0|nr:uncharacterized protein INS49_001495 [Diaporthe citri]KAG6367308.1 hypothetical protein INS49_001495 [Diaporthe citri]
MFNDPRYEQLCLKKAKELIEARLKGVQDWEPHFRAAYNGLTKSKISKYRRGVPEMESLSDDQIQSVYRDIVFSKFCESLEPDPISPVSSPPPQQPHGQADAADDRSPENECEQSPRASESHSQQSEDASNHERPSTTSASSRSPSKPPSASSVSQSTDGIQSPENVETEASRPAAILDAFHQFFTRTSSEQPAKLVLEIPSSIYVPNQGPQSSPPAQSARTHDAVGQDQNGKQKDNPAQTAIEAPEAPLPSQPAQIGAQQQQLPDAQLVPADGVSADLTTSESVSERVSVTVMSGKLSKRFQRRLHLFQIGDPTVNQANALLSLALELMEQVTQDPLLSHSMDPSRLEKFNSSREELNKVICQVEVPLLIKMMKVQWTGTRVEQA